MEERRVLQFRIFGRVFTIFWKKSGKDYSFNFRSTFLEKPCVGINSNVYGSDIYKNQLHFFMGDFDDILTLKQLKKKVREVQDRFKDLVGDGYIYETSPNKFSLHFYQLSTYWEWMKVIHFLNDCLDTSYVRWRLRRNSMVMRLSPKSSGYIPKLIEVVKTKYHKGEDEFSKRMILQNLNSEVKIKDGSYTKN